MIETDNAKILTAAERKAIRDNAEKLEQIYLSKSCPVGMITPFPVPSVVYVGSNVMAQPYPGRIMQLYFLMTPMGVFLKRNK